MASPGANDAPQSDLLAGLATFCGEHGPKIVLFTRLQRQGGEGSEACQASPDGEGSPHSQARPPASCAACTSLRHEGDPDTVRRLRSQLTSEVASVSGDLDQSSPSCARLLKATEMAFYVESPDTEVSLFGDRLGGLVFAKKFQVRDHREVRGFSRRLCILVLCQDRSLLERQLDSVTSLASELTESLVRMAEANFDERAHADLVQEQQRPHSNGALLALLGQQPQQSPVHPSPPRNLSGLTHPRVYPLVHGALTMILWRLWQGRTSLHLCGPPLVTSEALASADGGGRVPPLSLKDVASAANRAQFCQLLGTLTCGAPVGFTSGSRSLLESLLLCLGQVLPPRARKFTIWKDDLEDTETFRGLFAASDDPDLPRWFRAHLLGKEEVVLHAEDDRSLTLAGLAMVSRAKGASAGGGPLIATKITSLAYSDTSDPGVVATAAEALVERYATWARVWERRKKVGEVGEVQGLNLRHCERKVLLFWGRHMDK